MRLEGVYVPLLTPLRGGGSVDEHAVAGHAERILAGGVDGLVALGTTGEFADLDAEERARVVAATVKAAGGRVPVLAGVGATGTTEACAHARAAADAGADAVLALPPLYWKLGADGLVRHYEAVCAATDLPVVLYDFPSLSGTPLDPPVVARIASALERVVGIKLSGPELRVAHGVVASVKPDRPEFAVLVGAADLVLPGLLGGSDGTIAAIGNVDPAPLVDLVGAFTAGDLAAARDAHARVLRLLAIPALAAPPILALKAAAQAAGSPLEPVVRTPPDDADRVVTRARALTADLLT